MNITATVSSNDNGGQDGTVTDPSGQVWQWERSDGSNPAMGGPYCDVFIMLYDGEGGSEAVQACDQLPTRDLCDLFDAIEAEIYRN